MRKRKKNVFRQAGSYDDYMNLRHYIFCLLWLWKNRTWKDTRQKLKAMNKAWEKRRKIGRG